MAANRQTDIHTHARAQCSHASVGLAQARPKYLLVMGFRVLVIETITKNYVKPGNY